MQNDRVRDTKEANHRIVNGESKELDEEFTLLNGVKAKAPGQSGTAYNDCNCRCILVYEIKSNEADKAFGGNTPKSIDFGGGSGIIKEMGGRVVISMQFFAEKDIKKKNSNSLKRTIKKYESNIELHKDKINYPEKYVPE